MKPEYALIISECADWSTVWALEDARKALRAARINGHALANIEREIKKRKEKHGLRDYEALRRSRYIIPDLAALLRSNPDADEY